MYSSTKLIGRLGADPDPFTTKANQTGCRFSIATSSYGKDGTEYTEWHRCVVFGKSAEFAINYLGKGSLVFIDGRNQTSKFEKDGQTHYSTDVVAHRVLSLEKKKDNPNANVAADTSIPADVDDVPF